MNHVLLEGGGHLRSFLDTAVTVLLEQAVDRVLAQVGECFDVALTPKPSAPKRTTKSRRAKKSSTRKPAKTKAKRVRVDEIAEPSPKAVHASVAPSLPLTAEQSSLLARIKGRVA